MVDMHNIPKNKLHLVWVVIISFLSVLLSSQICCITL